MIILRKLQQWMGTPSCDACGTRALVRVMTVNAQSGATNSLVLCAECESSLATKFDKRKQASALKQLGIKSKPWAPDNET